MIEEIHLEERLCRDGWDGYDPSLSASENAANFAPGDDEDFARGYQKGWDDRAAGKDYDDAYVTTKEGSN